MSTAASAKSKINQELELYRLFTEGKVQNRQNTSESMSGQYSNQ